MVWSDSMAQGVFAACSSRFPRGFEVYNAFSVMHQKIDFLRLAILYVYGGIYIDMDVECTRPLDELFAQYKNAKCLVGLTDSSSLESYVMTGESVTYNNGIIASVPSSLAIAKIIDDIIAIPIAKYEALRNSDRINMTTGPPAFSVSVKYILENHPEEVAVLREEVFKGCFGGDAHHGSCQQAALQDKNTYLLHKYEMSWIEDKYKYAMVFITFMINTNRYVCFGVIITGFVLLNMFLTRRCPLLALVLAVIFTRAVTYAIDRIGALNYSQPLRDFGHSILPDNEKYIHAVQPYIDTLCAIPIVLAMLKADKSLRDTIMRQLSILYTMRAIFMFITIIPHQKSCQTNPEMFECLARGCNDKIFSGHTTLLIVGLYYMYQLYGGPVSAYFAVAAVAAFLILSTHMHYSIDVFVAYLAVFAVLTSKMLKN